MTFFESLLLLLLVAIGLLQVARRLRLPYPALLAGAGVVVAFLPGTPNIPIDPETYLALFIAPVLVDAAYDFPPGATRRFLAPLIAFAVFGVLVTAVAVAFLAHLELGMSMIAGLALGAIVAPPDAAAASAVLRGFALPRNVFAVLQGESLFNDSTSLLLFSTALAVLQTHSMHTGAALRLGLAVPGGILFGVAAAYVARYLTNLANGTLGGNLLQFILAYGVWIVASHLELSAVLATVAFAMTLARQTGATGFNARMRVQSYAVWSAVVFLLNVAAFMLMGMQAKLIVGRMDAAKLHTSLAFAAVVVVVIVIVRMGVVLSFRGLDTAWERLHHRPAPAPTSHAVFVGWCGMRGFVTMATALALPATFPHRDIAVLTAFIVVLATLVLQGVTLSPLIRWLKLDRSHCTTQEVAAARVAMADAALAALAGQDSSEARNLRERFHVVRHANIAGGSGKPLQRLRTLGLRTVEAQRNALEEVRLRNEIDVETYLGLQEQIDWFEITMLTDEERRIEEI